MSLNVGSVLLNFPRQGLPSYSSLVSCLITYDQSSPVFFYSAPFVIMHCNVDPLANNHFEKVDLNQASKTRRRVSSSEQSSKDIVNRTYDDGFSSSLSPFEFIRSIPHTKKTSLVAVGVVGNKISTRR